MVKLVRCRTGYTGLTVKLYLDFLLVGGDWDVLDLQVVQGSTVLAIIIKIIPTPTNSRLIIALCSELATKKYFVRKIIIQLFWGRYNNQSYRSPQNR